MHSSNVITSQQMHDNMPKGTGHGTFSNVICVGVFNAYRAQWHMGMTPSTGIYTVFKAMLSS